MGTLIYIILIAICVVLVYNFICYLKQKRGIRFMDSKPLEYLATLLIGIILAGVVAFLFKFIAIPLILLIALYLISVKNTR